MIKIGFFAEIDRICELGNIEQIREELSNHSELIEDPNSDVYKYLTKKLSDSIKKNAGEISSAIIEEIIYAMANKTIKEAQINNLEITKNK